jgi:hypothetical protein
MHVTKYNALTFSDEPDQTADGATWAYAGIAGGIVSSVASVPMKAASSVTRQGSVVGMRNYLTCMQIHTDTLGAVTEVMVLDGATVIWRGKLALTNNPIDINFDPGTVKTSPNTALNVQLGSSVTGGVFVNAQGYVGN